MQTYKKVFVDANGNRQAGATMNVYVTGSAVRPQLYDEFGAPKSNPFVSTTEGEVIFQADDASVDVFGTSASGLLEYTDRNVELFDARAAFDLLLMSQNEGVVGAALLSDLATADYLALPNKTLVLVGNDPVESNNKYYRKVGEPGAGTFVASADRVVAEAEARRAGDAALMNQLLIGHPSLAARWGTAAQYLGAWGGWAFGVDGGVDIAAGSVVTRIATRLQVPAGTDHITLGVLGRPTAGGTIDNGPGASGDATVIPTSDYSPAGLGLTLGASAVVEVIFELPASFTIVNGTTYIPVIEAWNAAGERVTLGVGAVAQSGLPVRSRGWTRVNAAAGWSAVDGGANAVVWRFESTVYATGSDVATAKANATAAQSTANSAVSKADFALGLFRSFQTLATRWGTSNSYVIGTWAGWAFGVDGGVDIAAGTVVSRIATRLQVPVGTSRVSLGLLGRTTAGPTIDSIPGAAGDTTVMPSSDYSPAGLGLTPGASAVIDVVFELPATFTIVNGTTYIPVVEAWNAAGDRLAIGIGAVAQSGLPAHSRGWTRINTSAGWSAVDVAGNAVVWRFESTVYATGTDINTAKSTAASAKASADVALGLFRYFTTLGTRWGTFAYSIGAWGGWAFSVDGGVDVAAGSIVTRIATRLQIPAGTDRVTLTTLSRLTAGPTVDSSPGAAGDLTVVPATNYTPTQLGLTPGAATVADVVIDLANSFTAANGTTYVFVLEAWNAAGDRVVIGIGAAAQSGLPAHSRGWYRTGVSTGWSTVGVSGNAVVWRLDTTQYWSGTDIAANKTALAKLDPEITPTFALPQRLFFTSGRPMPLFWANLGPARIDRDVFVASVSSAPSSGLPMVRESTTAIEIDPARLGSTLTILIRRRGVVEQRVRKSVNVTVVPAAYAGSKPTRRIMLFGDSLAEKMIAEALEANLLARGITPTFVGTVRTQSIDGTTTSSRMGEARGGKAAADFVYRRVYSSSNNNTMRPLDPGQEAMYNGLDAWDAAGRKSYNPFIRAATGSDSASLIRNGYVFDPAFYLSRFSMAAPEELLISLPANDVLTWSMDTMLAQIAVDIPLIHQQWRAAAPDCRIAIYSDAWGYRDSYETYVAAHRAAMRSILSYVRSAGDANLHWLAPAAHMSEQAEWDFEVSSTDVTGLQTVVPSAATSGSIHLPGNSASLRLKAETLGSFVAAA